MSASWITHDGRGRPVPIGTMVDVQMFNGVVQSIIAGTGTYDLDGTPIPAERSAGWNGWVYDDGGPMGPKFKAYRVVVRNEQRERNAAMFRTWLDVREMEDAGMRADILPFQRPQPNGGALPAYAPGVVPFDSSNPDPVRARNALFEVGQSERNRRHDD